MRSIGKLPHSVPSRLLRTIRSVGPVSAVEMTAFGRDRSDGPAPARTKPLIPTGQAGKTSSWQGPSPLGTRWDWALISPLAIPVPFVSQR